MHFGSIDLSYIAWDDFVAALGWALLAGPAAVWLAGQLGFLPRGRSIGIYTPVLTAFLGVMILTQMRRWPF
jgi:hypothetical protein